jgi:hypothetical protein
VSRDGERTCSVVESGPGTPQLKAGAFNQFDVGIEPTLGAVRRGAVEPCADDSRRTAKIKRRDASDPTRIRQIV